MSGGDRPTIREVARRAGVSIGTVSNVLTGSRPVAATTREAVDAAISSLSYQPDQAGRALNSRRRRNGPSHPAGTPRLTTVGYLCADLTARLLALPACGARASASSIRKTLGGSAANVASVAAGLGAPLLVSVDLITVLGTDSESDWAADLLAQRGVALAAGSRRHDGHLSRCIVLVDGDGSRTVINEPLTVQKPVLRDWIDALPAASNLHCLHIQGDQLEELMDVLPLARDHGLILAFHAPGLPAALCNAEGLRLLASLFDLVLLDSDVARAMSGEQADPGRLVECFGHQLGSGRRATVVLTMEADGAAIFEKGRSPVLLEADRVTPVDRTGAGDCFAGTFLAAWLCGHSLSSAGRLAVQAATGSVLVPGAQEFRPRAEMLLSPHREEAV